MLVVWESFLTISNNFQPQRGNAAIYGSPDTFTVDMESMQSVHHLGTGVQRWVHLHFCPFLSQGNPPRHERKSGLETTNDANWSVENANGLNANTFVRSLLPRPCFSTTISTKTDCGTISFFRRFLVQIDQGYSIQRGWVGSWGPRKPRGPRGDGIRWWSQLAVARKF